MNKIQQTIIDQAFNIIRENMIGYDVTINEPTAAVQAVQAKIGTCEQEKFGLIYLTNQNTVIEIEVMFTGTIDSASVYPREIMRNVLKHNAAAVILFHNHPSGMCAPSQADKRMTTKITEALQYIDVRVLDHFIVSGTNHMSFAQQGLI